MDYAARPMRATQASSLPTSPQTSLRSPDFLQPTMDIEAQKRAAAARAVEFVRPGMRLGLGSGSTAKHFVELLAERVRAGLDVIGVPTSETTPRDAGRLGGAPPPPARA